MEEATTIRVGHSPFSNLFIIYGKFPIDFLILIVRPQFIHEFVIIGVSSTGRAEISFQECAVWRSLFSI